MEGVYYSFATYLDYLFISLSGIHSDPFPRSSRMTGKAMQLLLPTLLCRINSLIVTLALESAMQVPLLREREGAVDTVFYPCCENQNSN